MRRENEAQLRRALLAWYRRSRRDLPWRATRDPYNIWISEVMLQQTRVAAVLPYYERFVARFPGPVELARADEEEVLNSWAGLGYYSRARNLHATAKRVAEAGAFPSNYDAIRALPGIGEYTAAAIASIAFNLPYAVLDGNVARVVARLTAERGDIRSTKVRQRLRATASELLDRKRPGDFNQALMELGATVCLPRDPNCAACPVARQCEAKAQGLERELPVLRPRLEFRTEDITVMIVNGTDGLLLRRRPEGSARLAGLWELPDNKALPRAKIVQEFAAFRHTIVSTKYICRVAVAEIDDGQPLNGFQWVRTADVKTVPLSTTARKALARYEARFRP